MPRNSQDVYSLSSEATVNSGDVISAANYNATIQDLAGEQIAARPISAGGTGASSATTARSNLGITTLLADKMDADASVPTSQITDFADNVKDEAAASILVSGALTKAYDADTHVLTLTNTNPLNVAGNGLTLGVDEATFSVDADQSSNVTRFGVSDTTYVDSAADDVSMVFANAEHFRFTNGGDLHASADIIGFSTTISDPRLKTNVRRIDDALVRLQHLSGYEFTYKVNGKPSAGVMSTEVTKALPSAVSQSHLPLHSDDFQLYDVVQYDQLHALLIEAVKSLAQRVEDLENAAAN